MYKEELQLIRKLRHDLHRAAELSMEEFNTLNIIRGFLKEHTSLKIVDCGNWMYAVKEGRRDGEAVVLRAELDALPVPENLDISYASADEGVSHKCGHDGHCAALCGLALELEKVETENSICLLFQPGEETGEGALICKEILKKEQVRQIYAFHNLSGFPEGSIVYRPGLTQPASEGLRITVNGVRSHAAEPEKGKNPAVLISELALYADKLNRQNDGTLRLSTVTGIKVGSGDFGISPGDGEICLTLRAEEESELKQMEQAVISRAKELAGADSFGLEHSVQDYFPETRNHEPAIKRVLEAAAQNDFPVIRMDEMFRASEDFGWYLKECQGAIFYIGNGDEYPALHSSGYDFNDNILETAFSMFMALI